MIAVPVSLSDDREGMARKFSAIARGLVALCVVEIQSGQIPRLYKSGVVYRRERAPRERWLSCSLVIACGYGDCEDLSAWRTAEQQVSGVDCEVWVAPSGSGYHAVVRYSDGTTEDPSAILIRREKYGKRR